MTKLIAFVLAASLCIGSASAVDVYETKQDALPLFMMSSDSGVSSVAADADWYDYVLQNLEWIMADIDNIEDFSEDISLNVLGIGDLLYDILDVLGTNMDGTIAAMLSSSLEYLADTAGWLGVYDGGLQLNQFLELLDCSILSVGGSVDSVDSSVQSLLTSLNRHFTLPAGTSFLGPTGSDLTLSSDQSFWYVFSRSLMGLNSSLVSNLSLAAGTSMLGPGGSSVSFENPMKLSYVLSRGFLGLSSNIKGISSGNYSLSIFDSDSSDQRSLVVSTMGSMIDKYLDAMQDDLGALTFIHADSAAVQAKKDAANNSVAVTDNFLKPGSDASLSVSDIGDAAGAVSSTKDLFDTGVSIGQAFDQLQGSGPLEFFSSVTASNLNTVPATYSDDDDFVHFYDPSNSEFFELIGKGGD